MTIFQLLMLAGAAFFAYQVYMHIQNIDEESEPAFMQDIEEIEMEPDYNELIKQADEAFVDGQIEIAQKRLQDIVMRFPEVAEGMNKLAFVLNRQGNQLEAEKYYRASLKLEEDDVTYNALATLLVSMNNMEEAEECYKKALSIDDNYEVTWFNYANLMLRLGRLEEAKEMYERVLAIDPNFQEAKDELEQLK